MVFYFGFLKLFYTFIFHFKKTNHFQKLKLGLQLKIS